MYLVAPIIRVQCLDQLLFFRFMVSEDHNEVMATTDAAVVQLLEH